METIETKVIKEKQIIHSLYCCRCGKHLGDSKEYDDGYYVNIGEFEQHININDKGWFKFTANFCNKCREKFISELIAILESKGFKKDGD